MKIKRKTTAKTAITSLLQHSTIALSHHEIQTAIGTLCDRVTIYRILDRLVEEGTIHKIVNTDGVLKFAHCNSCVSHHQHHHLHFSCNLCKQVTCIEEVHPQFHLPQGYVAEQVHFTISGICPTCSQTHEH